MLINKKGMKGRSVSERFYSFVEKTDGCWTWLGCKDKDGYGFLRVQGKNIKAHRLSFGLHKQLMIDRKTLVCHSCDNPSCVNPDHLWAGSNSDNQIDCIRKKRKHGQKMTCEEVLKARKDYFNGKITQADLCKKYNISTGMMSQAINGGKWSHVN